MTMLSWTSMPGLTPSRPGPAERESDAHLTTRRYLSAAAAEHSAAAARSAPPPKYRVGDVMISGVVAAHEQAGFKQIVHALIRNHISAVPVIDAQRKVVGVVSESDLLARMSGGHLVLPTGHLVTGHAEERRKLHATTATELMTAPAVVTHPEVPIVDAAHLAARSRVRRLPVVDGDGVLVGMVTRADLLKVFLRPDEEIRDDIRHDFLAGARAFDPSRIDLEVQDGVVAVRGEMEHRSTLDELVRAIESIGGVVAVESAGVSCGIDDGAHAVHTPPRGHG